MCFNLNMSQSFFLHLVSDSTGETLHSVARACMAQFEGVTPIEKFWNLIRTEKQLDKVIQGVKDYPGPVLFTIINRDLRKSLRRRCKELEIPCIPILDPVMRELSSYLGKPIAGMPGLQHIMDQAYFDRIEAVDFSIHHDDGQSLETIEDAEIILVGVSRTSKTPTSLYLANRGIPTANIPLVPGVETPSQFFEIEGPFYVGLTEAADRLVEIRKNRLKTDGENDLRLSQNEYLSRDAIDEEVRKARKLFSKYRWPVIDVTKRSVEETAAEILTLYTRFKNKQRRANNLES